MRFKSLDEIFADDSDGLLNSKGSLSTVKTEDDRLVDSFHEINQFHKENERPPEHNMSNMSEWKLHKRLEDLKNSPEKITILEEHDHHNLLTPAKSIESIDDIFDDDDLGLFKDIDTSIFDTTNLPVEDKEKAETDFVARRKNCKDFDKYDAQFKKVQAELKSGRRKLLKFKEVSLVEGNYFVLDGVLLYLNKLIDIETEETGRNVTKVKLDGRTYTIFENGTESNMKFQSLSRGLYASGYLVSTPNSEVIQETEEKLQGITEDDTLTGYIYVLKSLAKKAEIQSIPDLYKIGFTIQTVEERISNAEKQSTYLMAPVHIVEAYPCFNLNAHKLESLLHTFFAPACVDIEVIDDSGNKRHPREWFSIPLNVIEEAIMMILDGSVVKFRYDVNKKMIIAR